MTVEYPAYADDEDWSDHAPTALAWSREKQATPLFGMEGYWQGSNVDPLPLRPAVEHPSVLAPLTKPKNPMPLSTGTILAGLAAVVVAIIVAYVTLLVVLL